MPAVFAIPLTKDAFLSLTGNVIQWTLSLARQVSSDRVKYRPLLSVDERDRSVACWPTVSTQDDQLLAACVGMGASMTQAMEGQGYSVERKEG